MPIRTAANKTRFQGKDEAAVDARADALEAAAAAANADEQAAATLAAGVDDDDAKAALELRSELAEAARAEAAREEAAHVSLRALHGDSVDGGERSEADIALGTPGSWPAPPRRRRRHRASRGTLVADVTARSSPRLCTHCTLTDTRRAAHAGRSLFLFSRTNPLRRLCVAIANSFLFTSLILLAIIANCVFIAGEGQIGVQIEAFAEQVRARAVTTPPSPTHSRA